LNGQGVLPGPHDGEEFMADVIFIGIIAGAFGLCAGFIELLRRR
jgi:hypothetical protein